VKAVLVSGGFMEGIKLTWERQDGQYSNGYNGKLGKWTVFTCTWDSTGHKDTPHSLRSLLPGIKNNLGNFATSELAFAKAVSVLSHWLNGAKS